MPARRPDFARLEIDPSRMPTRRGSGYYRRTRGLRDGMLYGEARTLPDGPNNTDWWLLLREGDDSLTTRGRGPITLRMPDGSIHGRVHQVNRATRAAVSEGTVGAVLGLPDFTYGIEIEAVLQPGMTRPQMAQILTDAGIEAYATGWNHITPTDGRWKLTTDNSIIVRGPSRHERGVEFVSPILQGPEGIRTIRAVCKVLNEHNVNVNKSCGLHVHIGAAGRPVEWFKHILHIYGEHERAIDSMVAPSRRDSIRGYCTATRITPAMLTAVSIGQLRQAHNAARPRNTQAVRFRKVNLESLTRHIDTGGTIEFRQHHGTTNANKIEHWVRFLLQIAERAKNDYQSVQTPSRNTSPTLEELFDLVGVNADTRRVLITQRNKFAGATRPLAVAA